jgi:predicted nucleotidyltransferase
VKAIYWDKEALLARLHEVSGEALQQFPEIVEIRLVGSMAQGTETGLSDVDLFLWLSESAEENPLERMKPYYSFFAGRLAVALDMIVAVREPGRFEACPERSRRACPEPSGRGPSGRGLVEEEILRGSLLLAGRDLQP